MREIKFRVLDKEKGTWIIFDLSPLLQEKYPQSNFLYTKKIWLFTNDINS